jgi:hypothetical protein
MDAKFWSGVASAIGVALTVGVARWFFTSWRPVITFDQTLIAGPIPAMAEVEFSRQQFIVAERFVVRNRGVRHLRDLRLRCQTGKYPAWSTKIESTASIDAARITFTQDSDDLLIEIPDFPRAERLIIDLIYPADWTPYGRSRLKGGSTDYRLLEAREFSRNRNFILFITISALLFAMPILIGSMNINDSVPNISSK